MYFSPYFDPNSPMITDFVVVKPLLDVLNSAWLGCLIGQIEKLVMYDEILLNEYFVKIVKYF